MRKFRFSGIVSKYFVPYVLIRAAGGSRDADGVWRTAQPEREARKGSVQPLSARLRAAEGGDYTESDRILYTASSHNTADVIEYQGIQYRVVEASEREYSDINQYVLRKVIANASVQANTVSDSPRA